MLLIWLLIPLLCVWLISLRQPLFTDRYLIWSSPAFYMLVALTLASLASSKNWHQWVTVPLLGIIVALNGVNIWKQVAIPTKSDFRAAAAYVAHYQNCAEPLEDPRQTAFEDLIIFQIPYGRYAFDYYFPIEEYRWAEGLYTNHRASTGKYRMSEQEAAWQMTQMTKGYDAVWLVATEVSMWDERNLVQRWLAEHTQRVAEAHFTRVDVYRYVLPGS